MKAAQVAAGLAGRQAAQRDRDPARPAHSRAGRLGAFHLRAGRLALALPRAGRHVPVRPARPDGVRTRPRHVRDRTRGLIRHSRRQDRLGNRRDRPTVRFARRRGPKSPLPPKPRSPNPGDRGDSVRSNGGLPPKDSATPSSSTPQKSSDAWPSKPTMTIPFAAIPLRLGCEGGVGAGPYPGQRRGHRTRLPRAGPCSGRGRDGAGRGENDPHVRIQESPDENG
jgi:hypothetical protein